MLASLGVIIIIIAVILRQYLNGTVLSSFVTLISAVTGMLLAFGYYELLADFIISKGYLITWAHSISMLLIFAVVFALVTAIGQFAAGTAIHFSDLPDKIISCGTGAVYAAISAGILLIALTMSPIPSKWLYSRYDTESFDLDSPSGILVPADSLAAGLAKTFSSGSMKTSKSFGSMHPDFLNQIHLNKLNSSEGVLSVAGKDALVTKTNGSYWKPTQRYTDSMGDPIDDELTIVRIGIKGGSVKDGGAANEEGELKFTLAQLRLIAADSVKPQNLFDSVDTQAIHPIGYVKTGTQVETKQAYEVITLTRSNFSNNPGYGYSAMLDLVFNVPSSQKPIAIAFRKNSIEKLGKPAAEDQIPGSMTFIQTANCEKQQADLTSVSGTKIKPGQLTAGQYLMSGLKFSMRFSTMMENPYQTTSGQQPVVSDNYFECGKIRFNPDSESIQNNPGQRANLSSLPGFIQKMPGYAPVALKCSVSANAGVVESSQFPVLIDTKGNKHFPVGLFGGGRKADQYIYQLDYCVKPENLNIKDNIVRASFSDQLWVVSEVEQMSELFFIYNVNVSDTTIFINAEVEGKKANFKGCEGFLVDRTSVR